MRPVRLYDNRSGNLLYLCQDGHGIGLYRKLEAYRLQDKGYDTYAASRELGYGDDERDYSVAADMLKTLDIKRVTLLSNNPDKKAQVAEAGIKVDSQVPTGVFLSAFNRKYLGQGIALKSHYRYLQARGACLMVALRSSINLPGGLQPWLFRLDGACDLLVVRVEDAGRGNNPSRSFTVNTPI